MANVKEIKTNVSEGITVEYEQVAENLYVFRRDLTRTITSTAWKGEKTTTTSVQSLADDKDLKKVLRGDYQSKLNAPKKFYVLTASNLETFRTENWNTAVYKMKRSEFGDRLFDCFIAGQWGRENIVKLDNELTLRSYDDELLPVAVHVDYYSGLNTHNGRWSLEMMSEHLKGRDDIKFSSGTKRDPIESIPYYNAEPDQTQFIGFTWMPTKESYQEVFEYAKALCDGDHVRTYMEFQHAMFDLDILGLKAAGANLYQDYYAQTRVSSNSPR